MKLIFVIVETRRKFVDHQGGPLGIPGGHKKLMSSRKNNTRGLSFKVNPGVEVESRYKTYYFQGALGPPEIRGRPLDPLGYRMGE